MRGKENLASQVCSREGAMMAARRKSNEEGGRFGCRVASLLASSCEEAELRTRKDFRTERVRLATQTVCRRVMKERKFEEV